MGDSNQIKWYVSSSGELKDITKVDTTHLINALAKHHRDIYSSVNKDELVKHSEQIALIDSELMRRNEVFADERFTNGK